MSQAFQLEDRSAVHVVWNPLQEGWGKTWSYVIAFGRFGVADISLRYSKDKTATIQRLSGVIDMGFASACCIQLTNYLRRGLSTDEITVWQGRDAKERIELHGESSQPETPLPGERAFRSLNFLHFNHHCQANCLFNSKHVKQFLRIMSKVRNLAV